MRTAVLRRVGNYKSNLPHTADMHMWMNAAAICDVGYVGGIPQGYYRVHSTNMHNANFNTSEPQGSIVDLRERLKCFVQMLADNPRVSGSKELLGTARRSLAREALRLAVRSYEWGTADQWPIEELVAFAAEISTPDDLRSLSRALARRQRLGVTRSRRYPPFVAVEQVYKLRSRLIMWRWRHAGI